MMIEFTHIGDATRSNWSHWKTWALILTLSATPCAWAKKRPVETYPAVEDESPSAPAVVPNPKAKSTSKAKTELRAFESVPHEQVEPIAKRLQVVEALLRRHGRAYDYRMHTLKELENILASLEPELPPPPAPQVKTPEPNSTNHSESDPDTSSDLL